MQSRAELADAASVLADTAVYVQMQPLHLQMHLCTCRYNTKVHASTDLHLLQIQICICFQSCDIYKHSAILADNSGCTRKLLGSYGQLANAPSAQHRTTTNTQQAGLWPTMSAVDQVFQICWLICTKDAHTNYASALAHKIVHLHSFCAHLNFRTQNLAEVQIPARLLFEFINLGTPKPNQSQ